MTLICFMPPELADLALGAPTAVSTISATNAIAAVAASTTISTVLVGASSVLVLGTRSLLLRVGALRLLLGCSPLGRQVSGASMHDYLDMKFLWSRCMAVVGIGATTVAVAVEVMVPIAVDS
jgi:hypothetical protein